LVAVILTFFALSSEHRSTARLAIAPRIGDFSDFHPGPREVPSLGPRPPGSCGQPSERTTRQPVDDAFTTFAEIRAVDAAPSTASKRFAVHIFFAEVTDFVDHAQYDCYSVD
jgi:hypothetical protein